MGWRHRRERMRMRAEAKRKAAAAAHDPAWCIQHHGEAQVRRGQLRAKAKVSQVIEKKAGVPKEQLELHQAVAENVCKLSNNVSQGDGRMFLARGRPPSLCAHFARCPLPARQRSCLGQQRMRGGLCRVAPLGSCKWATFGPALGTAEGEGCEDVLVARALLERVQAA